MKKPITTSRRVVADDDDPAPATGERPSAPTRELAQRLSAADEVLLLWHPETNQVELSLRDLATGADFRFQIAPDHAIDAFYHPYAYAAAHGRRRAAGHARDAGRDDNSCRTR